MKPNRIEISPELWSEVERLFDRMSDAADAEGEARQEPNPAVAAAALKLWANARNADARGFLAETITLVRQARGEEKPQFSPGQILAGRFTIRSLVGTGGMGEVYLAFDSRLNEQVAIKTVRAGMASDPVIRRRFLAEVQSARRVSHPNVCRINEIFDEGETPFLSMQFLKGTRLFDWLRNGPPDRTAARRIALELAEGLAAAHRSGIVHGDFKPANVILTGPAEKATPVITDFGLARALISSEPAGSEPSVPAAAADCRSLRAGTAGYMAPELVRGDRPSVSSDIYAYGKALGELLPGHPLIPRCMAETPQARPATLDPVIAALSGRSTRRGWLLAGCSAVAAGTGAYFLRPGSTFVLANRQRMAVNAFQSHNSDRAFMLRKLFITALSQSPLLTVMDDDRMGGLLKGWKRPALRPADRSALLAVAARVNALVVEGAVEQTGKVLKLALQVFAPGAAAPLLRLAEQVDDAKYTVRLADEMAHRLRRELGESAASLKGAYTPLESITSASPEAVDLYYSGVREYENLNAEAAIAFQERALGIDPDFALAHLQIGMALAARYRYAQAVPHYKQAFEQRSRLSDRERLQIEGRFFNIVADFDSCLQVCRKLVTLYPEEATFQRNMAFAMARVGKASAALQSNLNAVALAPDSPVNYAELVINLANANRCDEALVQAAAFREEGHTSSNLDWAIGVAYLGKEDAESALLAFDAMRKNPEDDRRSRLFRAGALIFQGRLAEASTMLAGDIAFDQANGEESLLWTRRSWLGMIEWLLDSPAHAREQLDQLVRLDAGPFTLQLFRECSILATSIGAGDLAEALFGKLQKIEQGWPSGHTQAARRVVEATLPGADPDRAAALLNEARGMRPDPLTHYALAVWQMARRDYSEALATLDTLEEQRGWIHHLYFPGLVVLGRVHRARCLAAMSRFEEAARLYRRILSTWGAHAGQCAIVREVLRDNRRLDSIQARGEKR